MVSHFWNVERSLAILWLREIFDIKRRIEEPRVMSNLRGLRATSSFVDQEYGIVDSGCTRTVSSNESVFEDLVMSSNTGYNLTLANDAQEEVAGLGYVGGLPALFAPGIGEDTLLSVMDITARGINVAFTVSEVILIHWTTGEVLYKPPR